MLSAVGFVLAPTAPVRQYVCVYPWLAFLLSEFRAVRAVNLCNLRNLWMIVRDPSISVGATLCVVCGWTVRTVAFLASLAVSPFPIDDCRVSIGGLGRDPSIGVGVTLSVICVHLCLSVVDHLRVRDLC